jgi:CBS domain-containing protein
MPEVKGTFESENNMEKELQSTPKLVRDLMTVGVVTCGTKTPVTTIAEAILEKDTEAVVVLDDEGHALGVAGKDELIKVYGRGDYHDLVAEDILEDGVPQFPPDIPLSAAAQLMLDQNIRVFFLMHHAGGIEYPAAVITYKHFLRHMAMKDPEDLKDIGISAERKAPLELFLERRDNQKQNQGTHLEN